MSHRDKPKVSHVYDVVLICIHRVDFTLTDSEDGCSLVLDVAIFRYEQLINLITRRASDGHKLFILSLTSTKFPTKR